MVDELYLPSGMQAIYIFLHLTNVGNVVACTLLGILATKRTLGFTDLAVSF